jgi:hypothetical protein
VIFMSDPWLSARMGIVLPRRWNRQSWEFSAGDIFANSVDLKTAVACSQYLSIYLYFHTALSTKQKVSSIRY